MDYLDGLFGLYGAGADAERKVFSVDDDQARRWEMVARVKEPVDYEIDEDDWMEGAVRKWSVVLFGNDARYLSHEENVVEGGESNFGGFMLGTTLGVALDEIDGYIECIGIGNGDAPMVMNISVLEDVSGPIVIEEITSGKQFIINDDWLDGDEIVLDSKLYTLTKNGTNILNLRQEGSIWPVVRGVSRFIIYGV